MTPVAVPGDASVAVIVPAVMGVGLVLSLATLVRDAVGRMRGHAARTRRVVALAHAAAVSTVAGTEAARRDRSGLRGRRQTTGAALLVLAFAAYLTPGATWNFFNPVSRMRELAWLWALTLTVVVLAGAVGLVLAAAALRWHDLPAATRPVLLSTAVTAAPVPSLERPATTTVAHAARPPQRRLLLLSAVALVVFAGLSLFVAVGDPRSVDDPALRAVQRVADLRRLRVLNPLAETESAFLVSALIGLTTWRCRVFALTFVLSLLAAWALALGTNRLVDRPRPNLLPHDLAAYPSGHVAVAALMTGLLPLALVVLTRRRGLPHLVGGALAVGLAGIAVDRVASRAHWPLDVVGSLLVALIVVPAALAVVLDPTGHRGCVRCPWGVRVAPASTAAPRRGLIAVRPGTAHRLRVGATLWLSAVVVVLVVLLWARGIPRTPEAGVLVRAIEVPLQLGLLSVLVVGQLVAQHRHRAGAVVLAAAGALLGYLASVQYRPVVSAALAGAVLVPAFLLWLSWQWAVRLRAVVELAFVTVLVLVAVVVAADRTWSYYFGPTHPSSTAPAPSRDVVDWAWAGGVTDTSFTVRTRTRREVQDVRLLVRPDAGTAGAARGPAVTAEPVKSDPQVFAATVTGLAPDTRYTWSVEVDGRTDPSRTGRLRTFPQGPASFTFAVGSCSLTGSNGAVFDAVRERDPLFFALLGDYLYANIETDDVSRFADAYATSLRAPGQAALLARTPVAYVWDDHDYSGNDGDRTATARPAALQAYRDDVPHYPLRLGEDGPIFQAFTVGRVRVVMTDNRSARTPVTTPDGLGKTMLGERQRAALLDELRGADRWAAVVWLNPTPWVQAESTTADGWGGYATERRLIADTIARNGVDNLLMVSGDAHMLALDDGSNTDFSTSGAGGFPLLHAAALDRRGNVKGGPYSGPVLPGGGQFGTVEVRDDGRSVVVTLRGYDWRGTELMELAVDLGAR